jgi:hypothetical protein
MKLRVVVFQNNFRIFRNIIMKKARNKNWQQNQVKNNFNKILYKIDKVHRQGQAKETCKCKKKNKIRIKIRESLM